MSAPDLFTSPFQEPLGLFSSPIPTPESFGESRCQRFEFACRGDRVPGRLLLPSGGEGPFPLILFQHGLGSHKEASPMDAAARWVQEGAAVACIDLPLHGERASAKLSRRLIESVESSLGGSQLDSVSSALWVEFARQAVLDLSRALDALTSSPEVDSSRTVCAGFDLGAALASIFCAVDPRPKAAALALAGGGYGPSQVDPCAYIAKLAPRPLLLVNAERDERMPRKATEALLAAARDPKQIEWFEPDHGQLSAAALRKMGGFLRAQLGL
jgi:dienelactone hydrolase